MQASYVEIRNVLKNIHLPLTKQELIQQAIKHGASYQIVEDLKNIPDREYTSSNDIVKEFCVKRSVE
jgi:Protein of unknown function (DUF2795)